MFTVKYIYDKHRDCQLHVRYFKLKVAEIRDFKNVPGGGGILK